MVFGMPMALFPALAAQRFGNPALVGYLYAAASAGALAASLASGWVARVRHQGVAVVLAASGWGAAIVAFGFATAFPAALLFVGLAGASDQISAIFRSTMLLTLAPDHMRGRLSGIEFMQVASAPALGNLEAGVVASLTSLRFSIVSGGFLCILGTLGAGLAFPALVRYDSRRRAPAPAPA
jgi:MFS family permease